MLLRLGLYDQRSITYKCMLVIVAPPIVMGVWSMAFLLGQHVEYYYIITIHAALKNSCRRSICTKSKHNIIMPPARFMQWLHVNSHRKGGGGGGAMLWGNSYF